MTDPLLGARVNGRYRLLERLGAGGVGEVYLAKDEHTGASLAWKALRRAHAAGGPTDALFRAEFQTLAGLRHPHILRVHDFGTIETLAPLSLEPHRGRAFFTAERVPGVDVCARFQRPAAAALDATAFLDVAAQVLRALSYVHARGIIHLDVKPANILVEARPRGPHAWLLDFGLAHERSPQPGGSGGGFLLPGRSLQPGGSGGGFLLPGRGERLLAARGTIAYAAPEALEGGLLDERADLWSLGATLYEALQGARPYGDLSPGESLRERLSRPLEPIHARRPDVPASLETWVLRLLSPAPHDRFPSADAALRELAHVSGRSLPLDTLETRRARVHGGRLTGRDRSLAAVGALSREGREGVSSSRAGAPLPRTSIVSGPAGIGRTRLLEEARRHALVSGSDVIAVEAGPHALSPWPEALAAARALRGAPAPPGGDLDAAVSLSLSARDEEDRSAALDGAAALFVELSRARPLLVTLDGLEGADPAALDLLARLARRAASDDGASLRLLAAVRTDSALPAPLAALVSDGVASAVPLSPLSLEEVRALTASMLGPLAPRGLADRLAAASGGVPRAIEETLRALADEGALEEGRPCPADLPLPETLGDALRRRLARLPRDERARVDALAVLEAPADLETIDALSAGETGVRAPLDPLLALERAGLVARADHLLTPLFTLASGALRRVALESLPPPRRRALHATQTLRLEATHLATPSDNATLDALARHAREASDAPRTTRYSLLAGERALAAGALERAAAHFAAALDASPSDAPDTHAAPLLRALRGRGEALLALGRAPAARLDLERLASLAPEDLDARIALARATAAAGDHRRAAQGLALVAREARAQGAPGPLAEALREGALLEFEGGRYDEALALFEEARGALSGEGREGVSSSRAGALERGGDAAARARLLRDQARCLLERGLVEEAHAAARESLAIEEARGDRLGAARALRSLTQALYYLGRYDEALAAADDAAARSAALGHAAGEAAARNHGGHVLHARGDVPAARARYLEAQALWRRAGDRPGLATAANNLGCVAETEGALGTAAERFLEAARLFEEIGYRGAVALAHANRASALAGLLRLTEARAEATEACARARAVGNPRIESEGRRAAAEVALREGRPEEAREEAARAATLARAIGNRAMLGQALRTLAAATRALGQPVEARAAIEEALRHALEIGDRPLAAAARLEAARQALQADRPGQALASAEAAREAAQRAGDRVCGARALGVAAEALLHAGALAQAALRAREAHAEAVALDATSCAHETACVLAKAERSLELLDAAERAADIAGAVPLSLEAALARASSAPPSEASELPALLDGIDRRARERGLLPLAAGASLEAARRLLAEGAAVEAATRARAVLDGALGSGAALLERRAAALLGRALQALGRGEEAAVHIRRSLAAAREAALDLPRPLREGFVALEEQALLGAAARSLLETSAHKAQEQRTGNREEGIQNLGVPRASESQGAARMGRDREPTRGDDGTTPEARAILAIADRILSGGLDLDLPRLLALACELVCEATRAERGFIMLLAPDGRLEVRAGRGFAAEAGADGRGVSRGIAERVLRGGAPVLVDEATEDARFKALESVVELRLRSILCAPLLARGVPVGVVYVDHQALARRFGPPDLRFLAAIAERLAPLIADRVRASERMEELRRAEERIAAAPREPYETRYGYEKIVGRSAAMVKMLKLLDRVVDSSHPVVVHGESGTGKELVARAIHFNGPRKLRPFVAENCAALSETLLEAELFGHVKGAFTGAEKDQKGLFELASGGTLFLDEVGDMSERMQGKLLRVLQEGEVRPVGAKRVVKVDVRVISASNKDLRTLVREGLFREDLFYRLSVIGVHLPPLRERREDIPALIDHFLGRAAPPDGRPRRVPKDVLRRLMSYDWPGNVRELENEVARLVALSEHEISAEALSPKLREEIAPAPGAAPVALAPGSLRELFKGKTLRDVEEAVAREMILRTLEETGGHRSQAAERLGLPTSTLFNKMKRLGLG